jgi:hypothetical protein
MTGVATLTWAGRVGALSNADRNLHLLNDDGTSICGYQPPALRPATIRDFTPAGDLRSGGTFCETCRVKGMG